MLGKLVVVIAAGMLLSNLAVAQQAPVKKPAASAQGVADEHMDAERHTGHRDPGAAKGAKAPAAAKKPAAGSTGQAADEHMDAERHTGHRDAGKGKGAK